VALFSWQGKLSRRAILSLTLWGGATCYLSVLPAFGASGAAGGDLQARVAQFESTGDLSDARNLLEQRATNGADAAVAARQLAEFLSRHDQSGRRNAYLAWAAKESDPVNRKLALKQVVLVDFVEGDNANLKSDLGKYQQAGGTDFQLPKVIPVANRYSTVSIPGPLSSFARMAALSPDVAPDELLPALARNVATNGYHAAGNESLDQTEYLRLVIRYVGQARELESMAGGGQKIVIPACDSEQTGDLLRVLGYRMRGSCGTDIVLETVNPTRAFLTIDSGFPLTELERDLRANRRFEMPYRPTSVPVLYNAQYWLSAMERDPNTNFLDAFLSDPSICRLYLGLSHLDRATAEALRQQVPAPRLKLFGHVLDFYGSMFHIRDGAAVVPGSPKVWTSLVGASPSNPGAFFGRLIMRDDGWLASYFDALSRVQGPAATYLTQPERIRRFYDALRGKITVPGPARPVFRSSTDLLLLTTSLRIDPNGQAHVPGDVEVWRTLFVKHPHGKYDRKLSRAASDWRTPDDLLEGLFALSRKTVDNEPLKIFLTLNDIDRERARPISANLAARLIADYVHFSSQYVLFADEPELSEASIQRCLDMFVATAAVHDTALRADQLGTVQSLIEIWKIFCRQNLVDPSAQDALLVKLITPFGKQKQESDLFDAGQAGIREMLAAAHQPSTGSPQDQLITLLAGGLRTPGPNGLVSPAETFLRIFDAQHLIPLDSLFLIARAQGGKAVDPRALKSVSDQLKRLEEAQSMRADLSPEERSIISSGYWSDRHIEQEQKLDLESLTSGTAKKDVRETLAPFLRDSLVGIVYCYYAPVGAQILLTNPTFVRSHDFIGSQGTNIGWRTTDVAGSGWPSNDGGRLTGSLIAAPYALAEAEQNFLTPKREQALIWSDLVPQIIIDETVTRWRNVTPEQLRWVSLHMERGQNLLVEATLDPALKPKVLAALAGFLNPAGVEHIADQLEAGNFKGAEEQVPPAELYALGNDSSLMGSSPDMASVEIAALTAENRPDLSPAGIARTFGTPKPTLTHSYQPCLLHLRTFPALMGYSSRILAETWESDNLYYAALADQAGIPMDRLSSYVRLWNQATVENIFATNLEDWPALLRSLHSVGDRVLQHSPANGEARTYGPGTASDLSMN
jgi:hypothetical protein